MRGVNTCRAAYNALHWRTYVRNCAGPT
jgi:hypothetical protein